MKVINVTKTASRGIVIGKAFLVGQPEIKVGKNNINAEDVTNEIKRYENAVKNTADELEVLAKTNSIFDAHLEMVKDITLYEGVLSRIKGELLNAEAALELTADEFVLIFEGMEDEYMRERAADIKDIKHRLLCELQGIKINTFDNIKEEVILVARDLAPSDTARLNLNLILGFITQEGGVTSHVSIMARGLGLPALVGVESILQQVKSGDLIIMDASKGIIILDPEEPTILQYRQLQSVQLKQQEEMAQLSSLPAITTDGREITLCANVGSRKDITKATEHHIDGVGLFRSEFLYMDQDHFPTEQEQFEVYKEAALLLKDKELTIRTLDIGGDKELSYFKFEKEDNPFLGWRAIRISLELKDMFKTQLRAILRASAYGKLRIMLPMIISLEELRQAKALVVECMEELKSKGIPYVSDIEVGIMIETPASVILAEELAREVDFFSIGTNDLTQYLLAVDRGNNKIAAMYNSYHPSVLRSIQRVIQAGHKYQIKVGMCGEFASDPRAVQLLLGMGLDEFSMSASEIANVKYILRNTSYQEMQALAEQVCKLDTIEAVMKALQS